MFERTSWPTPLADATIIAHQALQELSGLAYLARRRTSGGDIQTASGTAAGDFRSSVSEMERLPADSVTSAIINSLLELADQVQGELDGITSGISLAEGVIRGAALGEDTEESRTLAALIVVATEWDIDPGAAARVLG